MIGLDHIGVAVADLAASVSFHTEVLGLRVVHREDNPEQLVREVMLSPGPVGATQIQLLAPLTEDSTVGRFLSRRGPGLHHVAYTVLDLEAVSEVLRRRGIRLIYDHPRAGTRGSSINFLAPSDTGGVLLELVQSGADPIGDAARR